MKNFACSYGLSSARTARRSTASLAYPLAILLTLAAFASPAQARAIDSLAGSVRGTVSVVDQKGQSCGAPGAQVRLIGATMDTFQSAIADYSGQYKFDSVLPGSYQLEVILEGFEKLTRPITIWAGETDVENITLVMKGVREEESARAERVGLNLKDAVPATEIKQPASHTDPVASEPLRKSVLLSMKGSGATHWGLTVNSIAAFDPAFPRHFLSTPNQVVHVPKFSSPEIHVLKSLSLSVSPRVRLGNQNHGRLTQFPDVQRFDPRDVQSSGANANFAAYSNSIGRLIGMRLVIEKK